MVKEFEENSKKKTKRKSKKSKTDDIEEDDSLITEETNKSIDHPPVSEDGKEENQENQEKEEEDRPSTPELEPSKSTESIEVIETTTSVRLRVGSSSIFCTVNENENDKNNNNPQEKSIEPMSTEDEQMNDDEEGIEKIEAVKNDHDGISFRIRLTNENESKWISSKIANKKYPQSVIAFWESHVEFT